MRALTRAREQVDVDVVALGAEGVLICSECKWTEEPSGIDVLKTLVHRLGLVVDDPKSIQLMLFSKSGFTDSVRREQKMGNARLVSSEELFS